MNEKEFQDYIDDLLKPPSIMDYDETLSLKQIFNLRLSELDLSQKQAEMLLGMEYRTLKGILDKTTQRVDISNLLKLSQFLGIAEDKILKHYTAKEMNSSVVEKLEHTKKQSFIVSNFDLTRLKQSKFIKSKTDVVNVEERINKFFGFDSIFEYSDIFYSPVFSRTKNSSNKLMRDFWVKSAYLHFLKLENPNEYDRSALVDLMPKIKPYTLNEERGILTVIQALYHAGVTIIYQPHLTTVQVRGATFIIDGKPCIVLTNLYENYPTLWFALLHELHHVLYDFDDVERNSYHLSGEPDLWLIQETKANEFAREYLFPYEKSKYIYPFIDDYVLVKRYADENEIHHSIIYSFFLHDERRKGMNLEWKYNKYIPDISHAIQCINTNLWEKETIDESVQIIRETVFTV